MEYTHWWGPHLHWSWMLPFLVMVLMLVFFFYMIRRAGRGRGTLWAPFGCCMPRRGPRQRWWAETPLQILARRYASGEITNEQYERIKRDIERSQSHDGTSGPS